MLELGPGMEVYDCFGYGAADLILLPAFGTRRPAFAVVVGSSWSIVPGWPER